MLLQYFFVGRHHCRPSQIMSLDSVTQRYFKDENMVMNCSEVTDQLKINSSPVEEAEADNKVCSPKPLSNGLMKSLISAEISKNLYSTIKNEVVKARVIEYFSNISEIHIPSKYTVEEFKEIRCDEMKTFLIENVSEIKMYFFNGEKDLEFNQIIPTSDVEWKVFVFTCCSKEEAEATNEVVSIGDDHIMCGETYVLPSALLSDMWDNLIFDTNIKQHLLDYSRTALLFSDQCVSPSIITWNRMVLLYGPPGTGKTSLCKAIAQKLSIRMSDRYKTMNLVEIRSENLLSKFFSESAKFVSAMFESIEAQLEDSNHLMFLLIDEVESLATMRRAANSSCEPSDAMRVVNSVLTHIDKLKRFPNVLVLVTSNITSLLDPAFLDRADVRFFVGRPSTSAIYSLYRSCINELIRTNIVSNGNLIPSFKTINGSSAKGDLDNKLLKITEKSVGLNGRTIRKLPLLAHAFFLPKVTAKSVNIPLEAFLDALSMGVDDQFLELKNLENEGTSEHAPERIVLK